MLIAIKALATTYNGKLQNKKVQLENGKSKYCDGDNRFLDIYDLTGFLQRLDIFL